jgi:hypothetical protein
VTKRVRTVLGRNWLRKHTLAAFLVFSSLIAAFTQQPTGLLVSPERYRKVPLMEVTGEKFNSLPLRTSLRKYCPVAGDQRAIGACVGWATGYGAMTIMLAQKWGLTNRADITEKALSAAFIFNQIKTKGDNCTDGAYLEDALELLKTKGDCLEKNFNYEKGDCQTQPSQTHLKEATMYKIKDYAAAFQLDEDGKSKIAKACKILSKETPLVVGMGITPSFWNIKPGATLWNPDDTEGVTSNHALLLVGYDNVEKEFELMNSFGAAWGRNGFIRIKFDDFERLCKYAFLLVPDDEKTGKTADNVAETRPNAESTPLSGAFVFRRPAGYLTTADGEEKPYFEEVATRYDANLGLYQPVQNTFSVGDAFQLVARQIPRGRYAYVFSQNPNGKINVHFPKAQIANFIMDKDAEIIIPSEESILQIPDAGDDYLCVVYSNSEIKDFDKRVSAVTGVGDFGQKVRKAFGDLLMPANLVQFEAGKMAFSVALPSNKTAVALLLKVTSK